jgi:hypothetical protein
MKQIDTKCPRCGHITEDVLLRERDSDGNYVMPRCGQWTEGTVDCNAIVERVYLGHAAHVSQDSIPGGMWIRNGICNPDGTPRRYDSFSDMRREAKARGLVNHVEHQGGKGSDKSRHTQRFI